MYDELQDIKEYVLDEDFFETDDFLSEEMLEEYRTSSNYKKTKKIIEEIVERTQEIDIEITKIITTEADTIEIAKLSIEYDLTPYSLHNKYASIYLDIAKTIVLRWVEHLKKLEIESTPIYEPKIYETTVLAGGRRKYKKKRTKKRMKKNFLGKKTFNKSLYKTKGKKGSLDQKKSKKKKFRSKKKRKFRSKKNETF